MLSVAITAPVSGSNGTFTQTVTKTEAGTTVTSLVTVTVTSVTRAIVIQTVTATTASVVPVPAGQPVSAQVRVLGCSGPAAGAPVTVTDLYLSQSQTQTTDVNGYATFTLTSGNNYEATSEGVVSSVFTPTSTGEIFNVDLCQGISLSILGGTFMGIPSDLLLAFAFLAAGVFLLRRRG